MAVTQTNQIIHFSEEECYTQLVQLFREKGEPLIYNYLMRHVRVKGFERGRIELSVDAEVPSDFAERAGKKLTEWTGKRWTVVQEQHDSKKTEAREATKSSSVILRDYQKELIENTRQSLAKHNSVVMQLPTGGGKTLTTAYIIHNAMLKGKRAIFCVHRIELLEQTSRAFKKMGIEHGFIQSGRDYEPEYLVHIASIQTLVNRLEEITPPDFLVIDESHRAMADTYKKVIEFWPEAKKLLITATPERLDRRGLKHVAQDMVLGKSPRWLIEQGYLSPYRIFSTPSVPDLSKVKTTAGEYNNAQLADIMNDAAITGDAVEHYKKHCNGMQAVVFAVNIEHSKSIVQSFLDAGIPAAHVDGTFSKIKREDAIERFRYGETKVLSNVNILTEGFDVPGIQAAILLRPTQSVSMYLQMIGRAMRPIYADGYDLETQEGRVQAIKASEKPAAIILDHAGCCKKHGLPVIDRFWSLEGEKGRPVVKFEETQVECEECRHVWEKKSGEPTECPVCGWKPERPEVSTKQKPGELEEITEKVNPWNWAATKRLSTVLDRAKTFDDLLNIAKARGYKPGWAYFRAKELGWEIPRT